MVEWGQGNQVIFFAQVTQNVAQPHQMCLRKKAPKWITSVI
jgi:hypothetical protein